MYRRLESKPIKIEASDSKTEKACLCSCRSEKSEDGEKSPEAITATIQLGQELFVNG